MVTRTAQSLLFLLLVAMPGLEASAQRFFPDDPLEAELPPVSTPDVARRTLSSVLNYFSSTFTKPGERHPSDGVILSQGVNTIGEVMDGAWFVNRHGRNRMSPDALQRGSGDSNPPATDAPWDVIVVRRAGYRTGILIQDSQDRQYLLRFDPADHLEMTTAAEMVSSRFMHAFGYWTPEDYLVYFDRSQLVAAPEGSDIDSLGRLRDLLDEDIDNLLDGVARDPARGYRAVATLVPNGTAIGPFKFEGTRSDDPNDLFRHEHRRDLRGFFVFSSFLNNTRSEPDSTFDTVIRTQVDGEPADVIRHYYIDFQATLGAELTRQKEARDGNDPIFSVEAAARNFLTFGIAGEPWMDADFPDLPSVGRFGCQTFDPRRWVPRYIPAPLANQLPDDRYWAAKILMAFTDDDVRTIVETGGYTDPAAETWVADCLIERRDRIARAYFEEVLPLENFRIEDDALRFDDLAEVYGFSEPRVFQIFWSRFDNLSDQDFAIPGATGVSLPQAMLDADAGEYFVGLISLEGSPVGRNEDGSSVAQRVDVWVRKEDSGFKIVGIDRVWPNRVAVQPRLEAFPDAPSRYDSLTDRQRELFDGYAARYSRETGFDLTAPEYWRVMSVSERTTFDAVTHALESTELSDESGNPLGNALELCAGIERVAGQYVGLGGDQQFRVYCRLREDAREVIESSIQFVRGHDNTVYHDGFPISYRQVGDAPTMQISMAEDGSRADVDVDYRSSGMPASMWNGHLTSANSDVRVGENYDLHVQRYGSFANWWSQLFGSFQETQVELLSLLSRQPPLEPLDLPPNRPAGFQSDDLVANSQEFLTDWLQRRNFDEAYRFLSDQAVRCLGESDEANPILITGLAQGRRALRSALERVADQLGPIENLIDAIEGVEPWRRDFFGIIDHPYRRAFSVFTITDEFAAQYICGGHPALASETDPLRALTEPGTYHGNLIRFRFGRDFGGTLGLIWAREDGQWKIVSYVLFRQ